MSRPSFDIGPIGLVSSGPGQGKTTAARILQIMLVRPILPFASPMKSMLRELLTAAGYSSEEAFNYLNTEEGKRQPLMQVPGKPTARRLLQTLGTEWGRDLLGERFWVELWEGQRDRLMNIYRLDDVIADDVRFTGEVDAIQRHNGVIWRIVRSDASSTEEVMGHRSEAGVSEDAINQTIINNGSIKDLEQALKAAVEGLH